MTTAREAIANGASKKAHALLGIPPRYQGKALIPSKTAEEAVRAMLEGKSLYLTGACGSGKTHLAVALLQSWYADGLELNGEGKIYPSRGRALFLPAIELMLEIKQSWNSDEGVKNESEKQIIDRYSSTAFLVLDDLGAEKISEGSRQVMYALLDRRYRNCAQTIITSNLSIERLQESFDDRIASRICEMGVVIDMGRKDWRVTK
ncbi:MAG: ATP-binding protein [Deltaproteobacteria bacterium]|nr:ATP-binding protein [Deltaproteobacteria bacterium]